MQNFQKEQSFKVGNQPQDKNQARIIIDSLRIDNAENEGLFILEQLFQTKQWNQGIFVDAIDYLFSFRAKDHSINSRLKLSPNYAGVITKSQIRRIDIVAIYSDPVKIYIIEELFKDTSLCAFIIDLLGRDVENLDNAIARYFVIAQYKYNTETIHSESMVLHSYLIGLGKRFNIDDNNLYDIDPYRIATIKSPLDQMLDKGVLRVAQIIETYELEDFSSFTSPSYLFYGLTVQEIYDSFIAKIYSPIAQSETSKNTKLITQLENFRRTSLSILELHGQGEIEIRSLAKRLNLESQFAASGIQFKGESSNFGLGQQNQIDSKRASNASSIIPIVRRVKDILESLTAMQIIDIPESNNAPKFLINFLSQKNKVIWKDIINRIIFHLKNNTFQSSDIDELIDWIRIILTDKNNDKNNDKKTKPTLNSTRSSYQPTELSSDQILGFQEKAKTYLAKYKIYEPYNPKDLMFNKIRAIITTSFEFAQYTSIVWHICNAIKKGSINKLSVAEQAQISKKRKMSMYEMNTLDKCIQIIGYIFLLHMTTIKIPFVELGKIHEQFYDGTVVEDIFALIDTSPRIGDIGDELYRKFLQPRSAQTTNRLDESFSPQTRTQPNSTNIIGTTIINKTGQNGLYYSGSVTIDPTANKPFEKNEFTTIPYDNHSVTIINEIPPVDVQDGFVLVRYELSELSVVGDKIQIPTPNLTKPTVIYDPDDIVRDFGVYYQNVFEDDTYPAQIPTGLLEVDVNNFNRRKTLTVLFKTVLPFDEFDTSQTGSLIETTSVYPSFSTGLNQNRMLGSASFLRQRYNNDTISIAINNFNRIYKLFVKIYEIDIEYDPAKMNSLFEDVFQIIENEKLTYPTYKGSDAKLSKKEFLDELLIFAVSRGDTSKRKYTLQQSETFKVLLEKSDFDPNKITKFEHVILLDYLYYSGEIDANELLGELQKFSHLYYTYDFGDSVSTINEYLRSDIAICDSANLAISQLYTMITSNESGTLVGYPNADSDPNIYSIDAHRIMWAYNDDTDSVELWDMTPVNGPGIDVLQQLRGSFLEREGETFDTRILAFPSVLIILVLAGGNKKLQKKLERILKGNINIIARTPFIQFLFQNIIADELNRLIDYKMSSLIPLITEANENYLRMINFLELARESVVYNPNKEYAKPSTDRLNSSIPIAVSDQISLLKSLIIYESIDQNLLLYRLLLPKIERINAASSPNNSQQNLFDNSYDWMGAAISDIRSSEYIDQGIVKTFLSSIFGN